MSCASVPGPPEDFAHGDAPREKRVPSELKLRADALEWREVDGEIVALDLGASAYVAVNRTGTVIWPALVKGAQREQLVAQLVERFEIDEATAARDLDAFLAQLAERDLLES